MNAGSGVSEPLRPVADSVLYSYARPFGIALRRPLGADMRYIQT